MILGAHGKGARLRAPDAHKGFRASLTATERARLPRDVDQVPMFDEITDQGRAGSCVPSAALGGCRQRMRAQGLGDWMGSVLSVYKLALQADSSYPEDVGTFPETVLKILSERGFGPESLGTYSDDPEALRRPLSADYEAEAQRTRVVAHMALERDRETVMSEIFAGNSVIFSFMLRESFEDVKSDGIVPMPSSLEAEIGGHEMRSAGYTPDYVKMANSWGRRFGRNGYCFMPWALVLDTYACRTIHSIQVVQHI